MTRYFATYSGKLINFTDIGYEDIDINDIAHHLCNINRFGGALPYDKFYSVAQHSIALCTYIYDLTDNDNLALHALLHDASEAYLGDVVSALKAILPDYKKIESYIQQLVYEKFDVTTSDKHTEVIDYYDKKILMDEVKALIPHRSELFSATGAEESIGLTLLTDVPKEKVEGVFLWWFNTLINSSKE